MTSYTRQMADFVANIKLADVPANVIARAKGLILDGLGCALYAADVEWTRILAGVVTRMEPKGGLASIWGRGETASPASAALVNGTMVQGFELDDVHPRGVIHSCAAVLPAAFAAAEYAGTANVSGERLLLAIITGFEIGPRVGMCMGRENMTLNGWHSGSLSAPFAAAAAAGVVMGLDSNQFAHALGIAGTQASGLVAASHGSMVKRMHEGKASQSGLYAALLAADGFTGIENVFEEKYGGFCSTFSHSDNQYDLTKLADGLGTDWETLRHAIKTYACRGGIHAPINAVDELIKENRFTADDVEDVTVHCTNAMAQKGGRNYEPAGLNRAQMNARFCIAMRLIEGDVFIDQMVEENTSRPDLVALTHRIKLVRSAEREQKGLDYWNGADVEVTLKNGKVLKKTVDFPLGSEQRPLTGEQMAHKFRRLATKALPKRKVAEIEKIVWDLEHAPTVTPLFKAMRGKRASRS